MRTIQRILGWAAWLLLTPALLGQTQGQNPHPGFFYAADFGQWNIVSQSPQTYTWTDTGVCQVPSPAGGVFNPFTAGDPILVRDALNPGHNEVVTVTAPVNTSAACGFTGSFLYTHTSFSVLSGTAGAQEAINALGGGSQPSQTGVLLDRRWYSNLTGLPNYTSATPGTVIGALLGNANVYLVDVTSAPWTYYVWNGAHYVSNGGSKAPTLTLGTGAGTSPSNATVAGNGSSGTVTFTSGTAPTASAAIFTLTWPTAAAGGFNHAPTCTVISTGATAYTSGTASSGYTPPAFETLTASATALTASTSYSFNYSCQ